MTYQLRALALLLGVVLGAALLAPPAAASAGGLEVTCTPPSSNNVTYNPPLTQSPQTVTVSSSVTYNPCVSLTQPTLTSGTRANVIVSTRSCPDLLASAPATFTINWNTGQSSTISGTSNTSTAGALIVVAITGTVTAGLFAGAAVTQVNTAPSAQILLCTLGLGTVSNLTSLVTLTITS
ncbi:hypothetical protein AB0I81_09170 [Nonomuraea sp. NPDC050404]|uniref:hypothetical protein n=1 Tax=Nonomuraea sp. NPDC050404 TaxID=3155783 RepID=UPI0033ED3EC6